MAASDFTAVNLASIGSIDLISIGSIGSIGLASGTDLNIVGSTAVGTERRTIVDRSRPPAGFQKPAGGRGRRCGVCGHAAAMPSLGTALPHGENFFPRRIDPHRRAPD